MSLFGHNHATLGAERIIYANLLLQRFIWIIFLVQIYFMVQIYILNTDRIK